MGEILGLGVTHFPGLMVAEDQTMTMILKRTLESDRVPADLKNPARWPEPMRREWGADEGMSAAVEHRRRLVDGFRAVRKELERFAPDFVVVFGDDQYENFREDMVPPFCVYATAEMESRPFKRPFYAGGNVWGDAPDSVVRTAGHPEGAKYLVTRLMEAGVDMTYAYTLRHELGLAHAFVNTQLYLDWDRQGFPWPFVPFHVNCYGSSIISKRGGFGHLKGPAGVPDPPGPSPARCFDVGAAVARALAPSPWRVALIASSSWSHAFLTEKTHFLHCDIDSDRARFEELRDGTLDRWRDLTTPQIEDAGQQELLNWVCLAGAMTALGRRAEVVDWVETWVFNSSKCFAVWRP